MKFIQLIITILILSVKCANLQAFEQHDSLTILAPTNMSFMLTEIIRNYSRGNHTNITGSFNSLKNLIKDIEEGFPADIIITNHPQWIKYLKQGGLINIASISNLAEDKLVLVTNKKNYHLNQNIFDNDNIKQKFYQNFTLIIPNHTELSTGKYTLELLDKHKLFTQDKIKIINHQNINKALSNHDNALMITNYSNTYDNNNINILEKFSVSSHQRFIYQIAIIASKEMQEAEKFLQFLKSPEILKIFSKYGFSIIE